jgi:ABC-type transporter Mla maintaining outer membrane lipid asymmetry ATPase subunit MlaF
MEPARERAFSAGLCGVIHIIGPSGVGKTTYLKKHNLSTVQDDGEWQAVVGGAARDGLSDEQLLQNMKRLKLPISVIACFAPAGVIQARNQQRHIQRPNKPDWSRCAERALETTEIACAWLQAKGVTVQRVDTCS